MRTSWPARLDQGQLALDLEARGIRLSTDPNHQFVVTIDGAVTADD